MMSDKIALMKIKEHTWNTISDEHGFFDDNGFLFSNERFVIKPVEREGYWRCTGKKQESNLEVNFILDMNSDRFSFNICENTDNGIVYLYGRDFIPTRSLKCDFKNIDKEFNDLISYLRSEILKVDEVIKDTIDYTEDILSTLNKDFKEVHSVLRPENPNRICYDKTFRMNDDTLTLDIVILKRSAKMGLDFSYDPKNHYNVKNLYRGFYPLYKFDTFKKELKSMVDLINDRTLINKYIGFYRKCRKVESKFVKEVMGL